MQKVLTLLILAVCFTEVWAVQSVSVSPGRKTIATTSSTVSLTWTINGTATATFGATSPQGTFLGPDGSTLGTVTSALSTGANICNPTACTVSESVTIPTSVISQALSKGWSYISYARTFTQSGIHSATGQSILVLAGRGGTFNITRIGLRFNDYARTKVIAANRPLKVMADVSYTGTGTLQARWEIATPPSTSGSPFYRNIRTVRQNLLGGGRKTLISPPLPTKLPGKYLVRLSITSPDLVFTTPVIRYNVGGKAKPKKREPIPQLIKKIQIHGPDSGALIGKNTRVEWNAINDATVAYRLEVFSVGKKPLPHPGQITHNPRYREMVTGVVVKSTTQETKLSAAVRSYLKAGQAYQWRVVALDEKGKPVGVSKTQLFYAE